MNKPLDTQSLHAYMLLWSVFQYLMTRDEVSDMDAINVVCQLRSELVCDIPNELWDMPLKEYMRETIEKRWSEYSQRNWEKRYCKLLHKTA